MPFPTFKSQEEIPEAFRGEYEERDGVWHPKEVEKGATRKQIEQREAKALKEAREAAERVQELEQELAAKTAGVSPEELQKLRAKLEEEYKGKLTERDAKIHELTFGAQLNALLAEANVIDVEDGRAVLGPRFVLSESGTLVPKDDKSIPAKKFLESTLRTEKPHLFRGSQANGGGASGSKGAPGGGGKLSYEEFTKLSPAEKQEYAKANEQKAA